MINVQSETVPWYLVWLRFVNFIAAVVTIITLVIYLTKEIPAIRAQRSFVLWQYAENVRTTLKEPGKSSEEYTEAIKKYYALRKLINEKAPLVLGEGINLEELVLYNENLNNVVASSASFKKSILFGVNLSECEFRNVDFSYAYLRVVSFKNCAFENINFENANISLSDFKGVTGLRQSEFKLAKVDRGFEPKNLPRSIKVTENMYSTPEHCGEINGNFLPCPFLRPSQWIRQSS